jgi:hypothetical protein
MAWLKAHAEKKKMAMNDWVRELLEGAAKGQVSLH